ncbi:hypothetical protein B0H14DRAFT_3878570 [Mycena olivaceomarginata]|nr:hypothetical protein B0H14DRAFT_3878570 [Mycena olivaceomarginata]
MASYPVFSCSRTTVFLSLLLALPSCLRPEPEAIMNASCAFNLKTQDSSMFTLDCAPLGRNFATLDTEKAESWFQFGYPVLMETVGVLRSSHSSRKWKTPNSQTED